MTDLRNQCRHYGGDCGQGDKCSNDCFEPTMSPPNRIFIQWPSDTFGLSRFNDTDIEYVRVPAQKPTIKDIMEIVCAYYKVTPYQMRWKSRKARFGHPRKIYAMLCRDFTNATFEEIGKSINRTSSSIQYARNTWMKFKTQLEYDSLSGQIKEKEKAYKLRHIYGGIHGESRNKKLFDRKKRETGVETH